MNGSSATSAIAPWVSTGHLPSAALVQSSVAAAHEQFKANDDGRNANHYLALARVPRELFGICIVGVTGAIYSVGDALAPFTIMSVSKPFADGGLNPLTKEQVLDATLCPPVLAAMATAGLYETSGDWLYDIGLPGKSGVGGGIITVAPGKGGLGTFSPPLDAAGNSVRGQLATKYLPEQLGLNLFASQPNNQPENKS